MQTCVLQVVFVPLSVGSWIHELVISFDCFLVTGTFLSLSLDGSGGSWNDELIYLGFSPCSRHLHICAWSKCWQWSDLFWFSSCGQQHLHTCLFFAAGPQPSSSSSSSSGLGLIIFRNSWMFDRTVIDHFGTSYKVDAIMPILSLISSQFFFLDLVILSHVHLVSCALNFTWSCHLQWLLWFLSVFFLSSVIDFGGYK
jgi:hypothetical protein